MVNIAILSNSDIFQTNFYLKNLNLLCPQLIVDTTNLSPLAVKTNFSHSGGWNGLEDQVKESARAANQNNLPFSTPPNFTEPNATT